MKKSFVLVLMLCLGLLAGCGQTANQQDAENKNNDPVKQSVITVVAPKSPASIPIFRMIESNCMGDGVQIDLQLYSDMEAMMSLASSGDYGALIVPVHTAANLYNKGISVELVNVCNWGGMYLSTTDPDCNSWEDLEGKELYVPSKGSIPDVLTQYFLDLHDLVIGEDVEIVYSNHTEIAQLLSAGTIKYAIDVQPYVTSNTKKIEGYKVISELSEEWKSTQGKEYTMPANCMVANSEYISGNEELIAKFNSKFAEAIEWTAGNSTEAGVLANTYLKADAELIAAAMPGFCFDYKSAADAKSDTEQYYNVLLKLKPESIGSMLPKESFYYRGN
ncbi:hypothetical protein ABDB91_04900 [Desulfoscipio sp. XC116]|uniref:ABC transporter substrate-binding protein n=1 Tax=Desulfoscipio sp. XC116 TaxID=3144975 RepID=UPI00325B8C38